MNPRPSRPGDGRKESPERSSDFSPAPGDGILFSRCPKHVDEVRSRGIKIHVESLSRTLASHFEDRRHKAERP